MFNSPVINQNGLIISGMGPIALHEAEATGFLHLRPETVHGIRDNVDLKANLISAAREAGIKASLMAPDVVARTHAPDNVATDIQIYLFPNGFDVKAQSKAKGTGGIELEVQLAAYCSLLALYEMCKAADPSLQITEIKLTRRQAENISV